MADPFVYDDTSQLSPAERLGSGHPSAMLRSLRDKIPENKDVPPPAFFMDPRSMSLSNMARGALDTASNWLEGPQALKDEDLLGPLGGSTLMSAVATAPVKGQLGAFIGPSQANRLRLPSTERGSIGALDRAKEAWAKGASDSPEDMAEIWAKEGWAPPESFGVRGNPFTWQELPGLRVADDIMDAHLAGGGRVISDTSLTRMLAPGQDLDRLLQASPDLAKAELSMTSGPGTPFNGLAGLTDRQTRDYASGRLPMPQGEDLVPTYMRATGSAPNPHEAAQVMLGHELRGHVVPKHGGVQTRTMNDAQRERMTTPVHSTRADDEILQQIQDIERRTRQTKDPLEKSMLFAQYQDLADLRRSTAREAGYFAKPAEVMARHADLLSRLEREGQSPFDYFNAPGLGALSTWQDNLVGGEHFLKRMPHGMAAMEPGTGAAKNVPFSSALAD